MDDGNCSSWTEPLYRWLVLIFVSPAIFWQLHTYDALIPLADVLT